jgi:hypothetical protein
MVVDFSFEGTPNIGSTIAKALEYINGITLYYIAILDFLGS